jgi:hypothetical protein
MRGSLKPPRSKPAITITTDEPVRLKVTEAWFAKAASRCSGAPIAFLQLGIQHSATTGRRMLRVKFGLCDSLFRSNHLALDFRVVVRDGLIPFALGPPLRPPAGGVGTMG